MNGWSYIVESHDGHELPGFFVDASRQIRQFIKDGVRSIKVLMNPDTWRKIYPASRIAIRDSDSHGMRMVKVFVDGVPVDYSYGNCGWEHLGPDWWLGIAQRSVLCLPGDEKAAAVAAYSEIFSEYADFSNDYEDGWASTYGLPRPGGWILEVPHFDGSTGMSCCDAIWTDLP